MNQITTILIFLVLLFFIYYFSSNKSECFGSFYPYDYGSYPFWSGADFPFYYPAYIPSIVDYPFEGDDGKNAYYSPFTGLSYNT